MKMKIMSVLALFFVSGCIGRLTEFHEYSRISEESFFIRLVDTLTEDETSVVYGNPFSFCCSVRDPNLHSISYKVILKDGAGKLFFSKSENDLLVRPGRYGWFSFVDVPLKLNYEDYFVQLDYECKDEKGNVFRKGEISSVLKYSYRRVRYVLPH